MLTEGQVIELVRRADPAPDQERLEPRHDALTLLAVDDGERAMKTLTPRETPAQATTRRWLRPMTAFAAGLVLVLGTIGIAALRSGDEPDAADEPVASTAASVTTEAPVTTAALEPEAPATTAAAPEPTAPPAATTPPTTEPPLTLADGTWTGMALGFRPSGVAPTSLGLMAWRGDDGEDRAGIYRSGDGVGWERVFSVDGWTGGGPNIVEHAGAVHVFLQSDSAGRFVLRSEDGTTWTQITLPSVPTDEAIVQGVVSKGDTLLAYGGDIVFLSANGIDWVALEAEESGLLENVLLEGVIAYDGRFYGTEYNDERILYASDTGADWQPVHTFAWDEFAWPDVGHDGVLYLSGFTFDQGLGPMEAALWRMPDGQTVERIDLASDVVPPGEGWTSAILFHERGVLLSFQVEPTDSHLIAGPGMDTLEIVDDPVFEGASGLSAVTFGDRILLFGEKNGVPYAWTWTPNN